MAIYQFGPSVAVLTASAADAGIILDCGTFDILNFDVENTGSAAVTSFALWGRITNSSPWRNLNISGFMALSQDIVDAADTAPGTLAAGSYSAFAFNSTRYAQIKIQAAGAGAILSINASGVEK